MHFPSSFTTYPADTVHGEITVLHAANGQPYLTVQKLHKPMYVHTEKKPRFFHLIEHQGPS